ncbi:hypothetical protein [Streptomyces sp. NPDC006785]
MDTSPRTAAGTRPVRRSRVPVAVVVVAVFLVCVATAIGVVSWVADDV